VVVGPQPGLLDRLAGQRGARLHDHLEGVLAGVGDNAVTGAPVGQQEPLGEHEAGHRYHGRREAHHQVGAGADERAHPAQDRRKAQRDHQLRGGDAVLLGPVVHRVDEPGF